MTPEYARSITRIGVHIAGVMREFQESMVRVARSLTRLGLIIEPRRRAPCFTCDGTIVAIDAPRAYAWCRCRNRWTFEAIMRGNRHPPARYSDHWGPGSFPPVALANHVHVTARPGINARWASSDRPLTLDDLFKLKRDIERRPL